MVHKDKTIRTLLNKFVNDIPEHEIGWAKNYLEEALEQRESKLVREAKQAQIQFDSNTCVKFGIPVLDYNADDNMTPLGRYFHAEYNQLTNERDG